MSIPELSPVVWAVSGVVFLLGVLGAGSWLIWHADNPQPADDLATDGEETPFGVGVAGAPYRAGDIVTVEAEILTVYQADEQLQVMLPGGHLVVLGFNDVD